MNVENLSMRRDIVFRFGDKDDGVIGIPCITHDGHVIEASYFYGKEKKKNIIVISSQINCPMKCTFCELGSERFIRSLTSQEMIDQVTLILEEAKKEGFTLENYPHKITIANTGEPLLNNIITESVYNLAQNYETSFKISTILPDIPLLKERITRLAEFANGYDKSFQLQISLISTSEEERQKIAGAKVANFKKIREVAELWRSRNPIGRKVNLSLIITSVMDCDPKKIAKIFPPELFRFRFREYVPTKNGRDNGLSVVSANKLIEVKSRFANGGYEVTHFASPTATERKFGLASNAIRRIYLNTINK
jgi:adenine C2-methylase RlmN of 23S rRNA A2503 and tRNA A37